MILERIQRFLTAVAVDPAPDSLDLSIYEDPGTPRLCDQARSLFGLEAEKKSSSGSGRSLTRWRRDRRDGTIDAGPFIAFYLEREELPPVEWAPSKRAVGLTITHWFEVKRPGADAPLFPGAELRSSVMIWVDSRSVNLSLRYAAPDMTDELRAAHEEIVTALGPKTPRHALQRIIPSRTTPGRERREPIV